MKRQVTDDELWGQLLRHLEGMLEALRQEYGAATRNPMVVHLQGAVVTLKRLKEQKRTRNGRIDR